MSKRLLIFLLLCQGSILFSQTEILLNPSSEDQARKTYKENKSKHLQCDWFLESQKPIPNVALAEQLYIAYFKEHPKEVSKPRTRFETWLATAKLYTNNNGLFETPNVVFEPKTTATKGRNNQREINNDWAHIGPRNRAKAWCGNNDNLTGGFCDRVYVNPYNTQNMFAGFSYGGLWVSNDQGTTWSLTDAEYPNGTNTYANRDYYYGEIEASNLNSTLVYAATEAGLLKSTNSGRNWTMCSQLNRSVSPQERPYYIAISPNNENVVLSTFGQKLYRSTNGGSTWSLVFDNSTGGSNHRFTWQYSMGTPFGLDERNYNLFGLEANLVTGEFYLGAWNSNNQACIYKSTDNGATFTFLINLTTSQKSTWGESTPLCLKTLPGLNNFFVYEQFVSGGLKYKFAPTGTLVASNIITNYTEAFSMDWYNENTMYQSTYSIDYLNKSTDNGTTFAIPYTPGTCNAMHYDARDISAVGDIVLIGTDGGITMSKNGGKNTLGTGFEINSMDMWGFSSSRKSDICVAGIDHEASNIRTNTGQWVRIKGADAQACSVHPYDDHWVYFNWGYGVSRGYIDDNSNFTEYGVADAYLDRLEFHPNNLNEIYGFRNNSILVHSFDNMTTADPIYDFEESINSIRISRVDGSVLYCLLSNNKIKKSIDGGRTWTLVTPPTSVTAGETSISSIDIGKNSDEIWAAYGNNQNTCKVVYSSNGGLTWTNITTPNLPPYAVTCIDYQRGTEGGVYLGIITPSGMTLWYKNKTMSQWAQVGTTHVLMGYISTRLFTVPAKGKIRFGSSRGAYEHDLYEPSRIDVSIASDVRTVNCSLDSVQFRDASAYPPGGVRFQWTFQGGFPATSTLENPKVSYPNAGKYNVSLKITTADGQTAEKTWTEFIERQVTDVCAASQGSGKAFSSTETSGATPLHTLPINSNTFSFAMWVKPDALQNSFSQLVSLTSPERFGIGFAFQGYAANTNLVFTSNSTSIDYNLTSPINLPINQWTHVAVNYTATSVQFYINGKLAWTVTGTFPVVNFTTQPLTINGDPHNQGGRYSGQIDELLVYNRTLTQDEIRQKMHLIRQPANEQGLVAYYQFDQYSPNTRYLYSTFGNNSALQLIPVERLVPSTAPVGIGKATLLSNIAANTTYTFPASRVSVKTGTVTAGSQLAATRIYTQPDQLPQNTKPNFSKNYWIIRSWNSAGDPNPAIQTLVLDSTHLSVNASAADSSVSLYRRPANGFDNIWGLPILTAQSIVKGVTGSATFASTTALQGEGQFIYNNAIELSPVTITTQPLSKTVCKGSLNSFTVVATGSNLTYLWQFSYDGVSGWDTAQDQGAYTSTLGPHANDFVYYRVIVSDASVSVISNVVKFTSTPLPIVDITGNLMACSGTTTTLTASGGNTYAWSNSATTANINVGVGTYTVTATTNGCSATKAISVVSDTIKPVISACPANQTLTATGTTVIATWTAPTATDNCATPSVSSNYNSGAAFPIGTTTVIYTAKDASNNTATCRFTVTVNPSPVTITKQPLSNTICQGGSNAFAVVATGTNLTYQWQSSANGTTAWTAITGATTTSYTANTTAYYRVIVSSGTVTATSNVVKLTINPLPIPSIAGVLSVCPNTTTSLTASGGTTYLWSNGSITANISVGAGTYTVTATTNNCKATKTVSVLSDTIKPVLSACPASKIVSTTGTSATTTWTTPTATDNCSPPSVSSNYNSGAAFPVGTTTVIYTAKDATNNTATCRFTITVSSITPTVITTQPVSSTVCQGVSTTFKVTATGGNLSYQWQRSSDGVSAWTAIAGATAATLTQTANLLTYYRVIVSGTGGSITSTVVKLTPKAIPTLTVTGNLNLCSKTSTTLTASGGNYYAWSNGKLTSSITAGIGKYSVKATLTATGCTASKTVSVVSDTVKPLLSACPANKTLTTTGTTAIATWTAPTATDNCSTTSVSSTYKSGTAFPIGTTVVTYTAADTKLNKSTCSFTVKVSKALFDVTNNNTLLELSAKADLNDIKLAWVNNSGDKNDYFEVQKLNKNSGDFEKIALINSLSTTKTEYYTAADANPVDGENVYRINLVATDGSQKVSNTSVVNYYKTADVGIFPNPTSDYVDIDLQHYEGQAATLYIYNNFGYLIQTKSIERVSKTPIHIDFDQPSSGQYLLRVVSQGRKDVVKKFMVQH